jgi:Domain of unknown function (DUF6430)
VEILKDLRSGRFWRHFAIHTFSAVGFFAIVLGLFDVLFPGVIPHGRGWLSACVVLISVAYGTYRAWPQPVEQSYSSPNTRIQLVKGDLFDQPGHLVIGMCNTFDTSTPHIIAKSSIQGQFLDRIYNGDTKELDQQLTSALKSFHPVGTIEKLGKKNRYPIGTVATLREHTRRFFCVAYTEMNGKNEARGTMDGIWRSLDSLWREISVQANGGRVSIPVIGGGQSRLSQILPAQDSIRFMALSFILASRREKVCDELAIVVQPKEFEKLDRLEIQSFLRSLRPS